MAARDTRVRSLPQSERVAVDLILSLQKLGIMPTEAWRSFYLSPVVPQPVRFKGKTAGLEQEGRVRTCHVEARMWRLELKLAALYSGRVETLQNDEFDNVWWPERLVFVNMGRGILTLNDADSIQFLLDLAKQR